MFRDPHPEPRRSPAPVRTLARLCSRRRRTLSVRTWTLLLLVLLAGLIWDQAGSRSFGFQASGASESVEAGNVDSQQPEGQTAAGDEHAGGHSSPVAPVLAGIVIILLLAKLGGDAFERLGMPAVLGELIIGVVLGNMAFLTGGWSNPEAGWHRLDFLKPPEEINVAHELQEFEKAIEGQSITTEHTAHLRELREKISEVNPYSAGAILKMLAEIGVILLLFEVGLESSVREMVSVGTSSLLVAVLGVIAPIILGYGAGVWIVPHEGWQAHVFLGATLCATSVGITARVLKDLGRSQQRESQIILGAAVIDDVLGLIVLAVVSSVIERGNIDLWGLLAIIGKAVGFLFGAVLLGNHIFTRPLFRAASILRGHGLLVATALVICFGFSWLANLVGLAPIVGAFAAGLILERAHYRELGQKENVQLEEALAPLTALLVPIFFVQMGIMVDLESFADPSVWGLAAAITVAAIIGKQVCSLGVLEKGLNRLAIGLGMIPRGEVGLIFANVGLTLFSEGEPVVTAGTYSATVVMVMLTTMVTPPLLKWSMSRKSGPDAGAGGGAGGTEDTHAADRH